MVSKEALLHVAKFANKNKVAEPTPGTTIMAELVYIGVDHTNIIPNTSSKGRPTTRIQSKYLYNSGLFILNLNHMPSGNGTYPSFWTYGPSWPNNGEIDILEGVYAMDYDQITLHVGDGCTMQYNDSQFFTGHYVNDKDSAGQYKQILNCYQYSQSST
uniref:GH16 domain-containing protein n=1 Tax=Acrobeloides nanus TaxID=290746 RepID=A0A914D6Q1_9BILA